MDQGAATEILLRKENQRCRKRKSPGGNFRHRKDGQLMKSKWHNISIPRDSFEELRQIQERMPIHHSIPQIIEWLIKVGQKQITSELHEKQRKII